jgi:hypothetical protein
MTTKGFSNDERRRISDDHCNGSSSAMTVCYGADRKPRRTPNARRTRVGAVTSVQCPKINRDRVTCTFINRGTASYHFESTYTSPQGQFVVIMTPLFCSEPSDS